MNYKSLSFVLLTTIALNSGYASDINEDNNSGEGSSSGANHYNLSDDLEQGQPRALTGTTLTRTQQNLTVDDITPEPSAVKRFFYSWGSILATGIIYIADKAQVYGQGISTACFGIAQLPGLESTYERTFVNIGLSVGITTTFAGVIKESAMSTAAICQNELNRNNANRT